MSTNYVANDEVMPTEVVFENGRKVSVVLDSQTGAPILEIGWGEYPKKRTPGYRLIGQGGGCD